MGNPTLKKQRVDNCRESLTLGGISFREFANGHFRVFKPGHEPLMDFWATTGKLKLHGSDEYEEGHDKIGRYIRKAYERDNAADKATARAAPISQAKAATTTGTNSEVPW